MKALIKTGMLCMLLCAGIGAGAQRPGPDDPVTLNKRGYAPVNGQQVYYEVHGDGPAIVLLHGAYMTIGMNWGQVIPELARGNKVIAIELQGHGHTPDSDRPLAYASLASDVAGVLKHLGVDSADVLGYSFGGTVAIQLAIQQPKLVKKLIVVSSNYKYDGWLPEVRAMLKTFKPEFFDATPLADEYKKVAPDTGHWHKFAEKMIAFDTQQYTLGEANVKNIKCPVLLVTADNDGMDLNETVAFYRLLGGGVFSDVAGQPQSQLAVVPGRGHVTLMMDPWAVMEIVDKFRNPPTPDYMKH